MPKYDKKKDKKNQSWQTCNHSNQGQANLKYPVKLVAYIIRLE